MAYEEFKGSVIAAEVQHQLEKALVFGQNGVINRNYEGAIAFKKSVTIVGIGSITVFDVPDNADMPDPEMSPAAEQEMTIDYQKGFNFKIQRTDQSQTAINIMDENNRESAYKMRDEVDSAIASLYLDADEDNLVGSDADPIVPDIAQDGGTNNIYNIIEDCNAALSESKIPQEGRWMIVPPRMASLIRKDLKLSGGVAPNLSTQTVLTGRIAEIGGFTLLESHNVPNTAGAKYKVMFGTNKAMTFANQLQEVRVMEMEKQFAKKVDGINTFGCKVTRPEFLGVATLSWS